MFFMVSFFLLELVRVHPWSTTIDFAFPGPRASRLFSTRCFLLVTRYSLLVIGYWLLVIGYWLLVIGDWLFVAFAFSSRLEP
ncbi:MAG: hypothetical protein ACOWWM_04110, partial [Desulfobacterales bacterium]